MKFYPIRKFLLISIIPLCLLCYYIGFTKGKNKTIQIKECENTFIKIDYPLIDIFFTSDDKWLLIDRSKMFTDNEKFNVIENSQELEFYKEWIKLFTFPVGRGTTPNGMVYIYKNKDLIKEIPYLEIRLENENVKKSFKKLTIDEIEKDFRIKLPPII